MTYSVEDQALALAGLFQSATLVHLIAHQGQCPDAVMEASLRALFVTHPERTVDVFSGLRGAQLGLQEMARVLHSQSGQKDLEILRYALNLVHLETQLRKQPDMLQVIGNRIEQARHTVNHFGYLHANTLANLASIYTDTISTFRLRIQVTGNPSHLRVDENATRIRALLLSGIRCAVLWRQTGGRRWHLVFRRKRLIATARQLLDRLEHSH